MPDLRDPSQLLYTPEEAAQMLRLSSRTIERWRTIGDGPVYLRVGRRIAYRLVDLQKWLESRASRHTAAARAADRLQPPHRRRRD